jgi:diadenosine tetraphosphate (Ap4A) HIT family hydrolase
MKDFTTIDTNRVLFKNDFFFIIKDAFPVSPGHLLIISNEVRRDYFELTNEERINLNELIQFAKDRNELWRSCWADCFSFSLSLDSKIYW